jgi:hypothetical protein
LRTTDSPKTNPCSVFGEPAIVSRVEAETEHRSAPITCRTTPEKRMRSCATWTGLRHQGRRCTDGTSAPRSGSTVRGTYPAMSRPMPDDKQQRAPQMPPGSM